MRALLTTFGTRGDVQPMLALAHGLRGRGHDVTFCAPPNYADWVSAHGFRFVGAGLDYAIVLRELTASYQRAFAVLAEEVPVQFTALEPLVEQADVVVTASLEYATATFAEVMHKPRRAVMFSPSTLPSSSYPMPLTPIYGMPRCLNALSWFVGDVASRLTMIRVVNEQRRARGLSPVRRSFEHVAGEGFFLPFDAALALAPEDCIAPVVQTGAWLLDDDTPLPDDVERFLQSGAPPVYLGFGSMPDKAAGTTTRLFADAIRASGVRALVAREPAEEIAAAGEVCFVGPLPHRALFPRTAGVVHHGGAGTTTAAALSAAPQLIVPHEVDQFFHGRRMCQLGLGPKAIPRSRLTARKLALALSELASGTFSIRAREVAQQMTREGVEQAVGALEQIAAAGAPAREPAMEAAG